MAKNRTIPFGYCMWNGKITVDLTESKAVIRIFEEYLNDSSLLKNIRRSSARNSLLRQTKNEFQRQLLYA